jgi:hypothetical protein
LKSWEMHVQHAHASERNFLFVHDVMSIILLPSINDGVSV